MVHRNDPSSCFLSYTSRIVCVWRIAVVPWLLLFSQILYTCKIQSYVCTWVQDVTNLVTTVKSFRGEHWDSFSVCRRRGPVYVRHVNFWDCTVLCSATLGKFGAKHFHTSCTQHNLSIIIMPVCPKPQEPWVCVGEQFQAWGSFNVCVCVCVSQ